VYIYYQLSREIESEKGTNLYGDGIYELQGRHILVLRAAQNVEIEVEK